MIRTSLDTVDLFHSYIQLFFLFFKASKYSYSDVPTPENM